MSKPKLLRFIIISINFLSLTNIYKESIDKMPCFNRLKLQKKMIRLSKTTYYTKTK